MPAINTSASARIGDADYTGVVTKTVMDTLDSLFAQDSVTVSLRPAYIAVGTGTSAASIYDTALDNETHRYPLTQLTQSSGITTALVNLPATSAAFAATELGVLAASGDLIARANVSIDKNENSILNIIWVLSISQGG